MTYWKREKDFITSVGELKQYMPLTQKDEIQLRKVVLRHPMRISKFYLSLIDFSKKDDPLKKMVVPTAAELDISGSYDTSDESKHTKLSGLQHKYKQTALILSTNRCASYCRFCFRKRLVGLDSTEIIKNFNHAVKYIQAHNEINNVLISGGDPLMLTTRVIKRFLELLSPIPHLEFIRFGTKVPVYYPKRLLENNALFDLLESYTHYKKQIYFVTQIDHPREITPELREIVQRLLKAGVIINNQTVFMRGVNDDPDVLAALMRKLVATGINPYYLFQCRPVKRVKRHFQIPLVKGYPIVEKAKAQLDGHSKRFRFVMSHKKGKIEIIGIKEDEMFFKFHQAKDERNAGRIFSHPLNPAATWLDDLNNPKNILWSTNDKRR
ncbi:MAG: KamA family radical SAM protein [Candidatus Cloacimonetes bacterium]|nr:KamA family radical SAM protein [Candidatus Cloacimonadota bacterium]